MTATSKPNQPSQSQSTQPQQPTPPANQRPSKESDVKTDPPSNDPSHPDRPGGPYSKPGSSGQPVSAQDDRAAREARGAHTPTSHDRPDLYNPNIRSDPEYGDAPIDPATGQPSYNPHTFGQYQAQPGEPSPKTATPGSPAQQAQARAAASGLPVSGDPNQPLDPNAPTTTTRSELEPQVEPAMQRALDEGEETRQRAADEKAKTGDTTKSTDPHKADEKAKK